MQPFCRTCFQETVDNTSAPLEQYIHQLVTCIPEMDLRILPDGKICDNCKEVLNISYKFKIQCKNIENRINNREVYVNPYLTTIKQEFGLNNIITSAICRICLKDSPNNKMFLSGVSFYKRQLMNCVPEIDLQTVPISNICEDCHMALYIICKFQAKCHETEIYIKNYLNIPSAVSFKDLYERRRITVKKEINEIESVLIKQEEVNLMNENEEVDVDLNKQIVAQKPITSTVKVLIKYIYTRDHEKPYKCSQCEYRTTTSYRLRNHILSHSDERPFECSQCEYSAKCQRYLDNHVLIHTDYDRSLKCPLCSFTTVRKESLRRHKLLHTDVKPFQCSLCNCKTRNKTNLKIHVMLAHGSGKPFQCLHCKYETRNKEHLRKHVVKHTSNKQFRCSQSKCKTRRKARRKTRVVKYSGDRQYRCLHCGYETENRKNFVKHILIHSERKPFKCSLCKYESNNRTNLKIHVMLKHNDGKPF